MHSVLVVIEPSPDNDGSVQPNQRQLFYPMMQELLKARKDIDRLGEHVLLIPVHNELFPYTEVCRICSGAGYKYRCIFFDEAPRWVPSKI